jgi:multicomponent Na+:H+ antiporter subunit D
MFAYSSISQIGYIIFALGIGSPLAILGGLFHLFNHAICKALLFLNSGSIEYSAGTRELDYLGGLNQQMKVTTQTSLVGAMAIAGIPPTAGFFSKLIIILAAVQARYFAASLVAILVSIVTLAYYLKFFKGTFLGKLNPTLKNINEVPGLMKLAMIVLAVISLISGLLLIPFCKPFLLSATEVLLQGRGYAEIVFANIK